MKNIFHRLSIIRIVIAAFFGVVVPYYAHAAATIKLDTELQIRSESDELALEKTSLDYNSATGFYDTDNSKYVTIYNKDLDGYSLFWCWDNSASGASDYFDYKKCSPYSVGVIIPSGQDVTTITLKLYKQATDFNWIRISYATNGGSHGAGYNNYYTWPRFCTNRATCTMPDPDGVFVRSGYKFDGWDASALHSTLTGAGAIAAGGTLGGQYITAKKDVTIKATWELEATKANVTIDMNGSVSNPPKLLGDCTSDSCYTPYDAPTRYGYDFTGWMVSVNGVVTDVSTDNNLAGTYEDIATLIQNAIEDQNITTSVDVVLTAQWVPKDVSINYACSTDGEIVKSETLKFDENFTVISKAESNSLCPKENYDIVYWQYNDDRYDLGATYNIDSLGYQLVPVYVYTPKTYKITYDCGDGGTLLAGYNNIYDVVFKESYATAGRICQKDGYVQTGWQTPNAATGGYYEYELDTEQNSYGFYSDRTFTAIYTPIQSYTITYDCGDGKLVVTDDATQTVNTLEKYTVKPKICDQPGFIHSGWQDSDGKTLNFYTGYEYTYNDDIELTATYRNDPDVPCYITFTSQYDVTNMPADMELQTGSTPTDPVQVPMLTSGFDKRFDGWSYYDSEHNMYFKYFDLNGNPVRSLDYDHCTKGMELQAQWVEKNNCSNKTIYEHSDGQTPVRDVYYSLVFSDTLEDYATDGEIYSDAQCENPISITESDMSNIIPENSTYNGVYGHYNVNTTTADIPCIQTDGTFANVEYCRKDTMVWYVKYICNDGYKEFNKQCVRATKVYFDGNAGDGAAASGGATYSEQIMYYGQALPDISGNTTPTLAGYKFMGWYDGPDYATSTQYYDANEQPVAGTWNKNTDTATLYAGWQPVVYTVIYDCGAGTLNGAKADTATWQREFIVAGPGRCSLANHVLTGWDAMPENTTTVSGTHPAGTKIPAWSYGTNMKFVAKYATQTDIDFDNNGGIGGEMGLTPDPVIATYGLALPEISPNNPTREGYTFTGWYDKDGEKYYNVDATPAVDAWDKKDAKVTLYAGWAGDTYTVTYDCTQYASDFNPYDQVEATLGESYTLAPSDRCLRTEYNLNQWVLTLENGTEVKFTPGTTVPEWSYIGDVTLVAEWTKTSVIYFDPMGGEGYSLTQSAPVVYGEQLPEIQSVPTKTGYTFTGWYDAVGKQYYNERNQAMVDSWDKKDATTYLYAHWDPKTYTVTYDCGDGELSGDKTGTATYDSDFTIANADRCQMSNHVLSEWEIMKSYNNEVLDTYKPGSTISPWKYETDMKLRAKYATQTEITFNNNGGFGGEMGQPGITSIATYGMALPEISPNNPTLTGYQFIGWYDGTDYATSTRYYNVDATPAVDAWDKEDANVTLYAGWKANTTIVSFDPNGGSGNKPTQITATYDATTPTLSGFTAPTRDGYTFTGWYNAKDEQYYRADGTPVIDIWNTALDTLILYAGWTEQSVTTTVTLVNGDANNGSTSFTYKDTDDWSTVTLQLPSIDGYEFGGYYQDQNCSGIQHIDSEGKLVMWGISDTEYTMYACWKANTTTVSFNLNGGSGTAPNTVDATYGLVLPEISSDYPTRTGHQFMGWYDGTNYATSTQYYDASGKPTASPWNKTDATTTLYAGWKEKTTDIIYTFNGLTNTINYSAVPGTPYVFPTFENLGFTNNNPYQTLTGWRLTWGNDYFEGKVGTQIPSDLLENVYDTTEDAKITATPLFDEIIGIELKFWYDENTPISNSNSCTDKSCVLQKFLGDHKTGHMFNGWAVRGEGKLSDVFPELTDLAEYINADTPKQINVYADWMPESYKLTYSCGDEATGGSQTFNITFGESHTIPDVTVCEMDRKKPLGWIINGTTYNSPTEIIWDIDVGDPDTTFVITPKWDDFYSTTLVTYRMLGQSGTILPDTCNNYTCVLPQNTYTYEGHTFSGWQVNNQTFNAGHDIKNLINADTPSQLHIVAQWQPNEYTLTYSCGDGATGTPPAAQNIQYNSEFTFTTNAGTCTKDGWNFIGWEIDNHQEQTFTWAYAENKTAIARWTENTSFVVTLNPNGGTGGQTSVNVEYGNKLSQLDSIPTRPYYIFTGFYDSADKQYFDEYGDGSNVTWDKKQNDTLYAHWQPQEFDVSYNCDTNDTDSVTPTNTTAKYEQLFTLAENTCKRTGHTFAGWTVDGISVPNSFKWTFTEPVIFTAQWTANGNYTVTLNPDNGDTRYYQLSNVVYNKQMSDIPNIPTRTGYTFDGYYYGNTQYFDKNGHCVKAYDIDKDVTMLAHWTPKTYTVRYQCGNDATGSTLSQAFVEYNQEYELLSGICNKEGYIFVGWKADNAGDMLYAGVPFTWTYDKNTTFVAQYTQNVYKVYLQYDGNGADNNYTPSLQTCTSDAECLLLPADTFTRRGYWFTGWIVGLTSIGVPFNPQDDIKQYITSARDGKTISVRARWTAVPYNVTYDANGGVSTLPKTECTIESCTPVSVGNIGTYMTRPGYVFKHWTTDLKIGNPANLSNGISQDTTLYAMWDACPIGYYKPDDVAADAQCLSCEKLSDPSTRTEYNATSNLASTSREDCAATCTPFNLQGGRATPVKDTVQYPEKCEYTAISDKGNPCNIVDNKCVEKSCDMGYELINNECILCPDENAVTYYQSNSCDIKSCKPGYHVNPSDIRQCDEDVIECYDVPNATYATKTWNTQAYSYEKCTAVECDTDYHIEDGVCIPDSRECDIENGIGWQEWLYKSKTWSECYAEQCNPGYESDGNGCVRCDNAYDEYGDLAASTYIQGCEIATCMYQGEKYILANNQCILVCYNDQDNTGAMWWDSNTKKCRRECSPGYSHWDQ